MQSSRIVRRDKKGFLTEQCKEIEENNRMGKTRDLFKKTGDTEGTSDAKMGTEKARNSKGLKEEKIKKRWQEYTDHYKNGVSDPDNHDGMITHLESDILECKVKWTLGSIIIRKLVEVTELQLSYFRS